MLVGRRSAARRRAGKAAPLPCRRSRALRKWERPRERGAPHVPEATRSPQTQREAGGSAPRPARMTRPPARRAHFFFSRERARQSGWWRRWRGRGGDESVRGRGGGESVDAEAAAGVPAVVLRRPDLHRQVAGCLTNRKSERSIPRDSGVRGSFPHEASDLPNAHMTHIQAGGCTEGVLQPLQHQIFGLQRSSAK